MIWREEECLIKENSELRALAREQLTGNWKNGVMMSLIYCLLNIMAIISGCITGVQFIITAIGFETLIHIGGDNNFIGLINIFITAVVMMQGYKKKFFLLQLSFLGWLFLGVLSLGVGLLWVLPYRKTTFANFYHEIREMYRQQYGQKKIIHIAAARERRMITIVN